MYFFRPQNWGKLGCITDLASFCSVSRSVHKHLTDPNKLTTKQQSWIFETEIRQLLDVLAEFVIRIALCVGIHSESSSSNNVQTQVAYHTKNIELGLKGLAMNVLDHINCSRNINLLFNINTLFSSTLLVQNATARTDALIHQVHSIFQFSTRECRRDSISGVFPIVIL